MNHKTPIPAFLLALTVLILTGCQSAENVSQLEPRTTQANVTEAAAETSPETFIQSTETTANIETEAINVVEVQPTTAEVTITQSVSQENQASIETPVETEVPPTSRSRRSRAS